MFLALCATGRRWPQLTCKERRCMTRDSEWNLKPDKIKLGKDLGLRPGRTGWDTLQWEMWSQHLVTSLDHFLGNPFYRVEYRLSREITGTYEGLQSFLLRRCFKPRIAIYFFFFFLVTVENKESSNSCAIFFKNTKCAVRNFKLFPLPIVPWIQST